MTERREFVENRETWETEYGNFIDRLSHMGDQFSIMIRRNPALLTDPLTVLDIGCAYGHYLHYLNRMNPKLKLYGVELSRHAVEAAGRLTEQAEIFWQAAHEPLSIPDDSVDVVYCLDMIEHISDMNELHGMMSEIRRVLKPGGCAFIETPNYNRRMRVLLRLTGQGHWLKYDHTNLFNEWKLEQLISPHLNLEYIHHRDSFNTGPHVPVVKGLFSKNHRISGFIMAQAMKP